MPASRIASSNAGAFQFASSDTRAAPINVTNGDTLIVVATIFNSGGASTPTITKASGTATIGTPVVDGSVNAIPGLTTQLRTVVVRVPITGSGSLSLTCTGTGLASVWGWVEFGGLPTTFSPVIVVNNGTGTSITSGNVVAPTGTTTGVIVMGWSDDSGTNPTYTPSDTTDWSETLASGVTGGQQDRIISAAGTYTESVTINASRSWHCITIGYFDSAGGSSIAEETDRAPMVIQTVDTIVSVWQRHLTRELDRARQIARLTGQRSVLA